MSFSQSTRTNAGLGGRVSPSPKVFSDDLTNRSSSPPPHSSPIPNNRSSYLRQQDGGRSESPSKVTTEEDVKFYRVGFERCAELPERALITNREKFIQALSYVGHDLPKATIDHLWTTNDRKITFKIFQRILNEEKAINERTLEEAFETFYNKDGKNDWSAVDYNRFRTDMLEKGDRFTEEEFERIRYALGTADHKVDVKKLTKAIGESKKMCRQKILTEKKEQKKDDSERLSSRENLTRPNSNNNVHIVIDPSSKKLSIPPKTRSLQTKGAFFCEYFDSPTEARYLSIGYTFEMKTNTPILITLEPNITSRYHTNKAFKQLDVRLLLFEKTRGSTNRRLLHISSERSGTKSYLQLDGLAKGSYEIIPITFGGVLRARSREVDERMPIKKLRETKKGNQFSMSRDYRDALEYIFDLFDFDDNKQLDRQEYNLWTIRTTGEEITNEDWLSIRDHVHLDVNENISKVKFLELNDFEVQEPATTEQDLWNGLKSLGFNYTLELDMMCPFNITVHNNDPDLTLKPTSYVDLNEIKEILIKFLQNKGEKIKLNNPSIQCYNYHDDCGSILFVENKGSSNARLSVQITNTENAALTLPTDARKPSIINIERNSSKIVWFAHKLDNQQAMELDAIVQIQ